MAGYGSVGTALEYQSKELRIYLGFFWDLFGVQLDFFGIYLGFIWGLVGFFWDLFGIYLGFSWIFLELFEDFQRCREFVLSFAYIHTPDKADLLGFSSSVGFIHTAYECVCMCVCMCVCVCVCVCLSQQMSHLQEHLTVSE